jgi:hypothetical protein
MSEKQNTTYNYVDIPLTLKINSIKNTKQTQNTNHETYRLDHGLDETLHFSYLTILEAVDSITGECQQISRTTSGPNILEAVAVCSVGFAGCT